MALHLIVKYNVHTKQNYSTCRLDHTVLRPYAPGVLAGFLGTALVWAAALVATTLSQNWAARSHSLTKPAVRREACRARWVRRGAGPGLGLSLHSQPACGPTATTFFSTATRLSRAPIVCDFGVEITRTFETEGEVYATETQGGEAAVAVHRGP